MTTYFSFAAVGRSPSSPTSQGGSSTIVSSEYPHFSTSIEHVYGQEEEKNDETSAADEADDESLEVSVLSDIQEQQPIPSYAESSIWDGIEDEELELSSSSSRTSSRESDTDKHRSFPAPVLSLSSSPASSRETDAVEDDEQGVFPAPAFSLRMSSSQASSASIESDTVTDEERGAFPAFSAEMCREVVDLDEASVVSNASLTPSIGANTIRTLETDLTSLKGLMLLEDPVEDESGTLLPSLLPPPPPPPGPPPLSIQELFGKPRSRTCSSTTSESTNDDSTASSIGEPEPDAFGEDKATTTEEFGYVECTTKVEDRGTMTEDSTAEAEDRATMTDISAAEADDKGTMTEVLTAEVGNKGTMTEDLTAEVDDKGTMTEDSTAEVEDKGTMTDSLEGELERKSAALYSIAYELVSTIEQLSLETSSSTGSTEASQRATLEQEGLDVDPLAPPSLYDTTGYLANMNDVVKTNTAQWKASLQRATLLKNNFRKEQRRWRKENDSLRDEVHKLKTEAEAAPVSPLDKTSAIASATSVHRGPRATRDDWSTHTVDEVARLNGELAKASSMMEDASLHIKRLGEERDDLRRKLAEATGQNFEDAAVDLD